MRLACHCYAEPSPDFRDGVVISASAFLCQYNHNQGDFVSGASMRPALCGRCTYEQRDDCGDGRGYPECMAAKA